MPRKKSLERGELSPQDEKYCQARADGKSQRKAYEISRPESIAAPDSKDVIASRKESDVKIQLRIEELKARASEGLILDRDALAAMLADFAASPDKSDAIRLKAADQLARIIGAYEDKSSLMISGGILTGKDKAEALRQYMETLNRP